jgi:hypothetical protein
MNRKDKSGSSVITDKLSRTAIEQFIRCPRCFYLERRMGLKPPSMVPLTLAVATDALLKNEFDIVRKTGESHPLWERHGLKVRAFQHPDIDNWRSNFKGLRFTHPTTGMIIYGAVDDIWLDQNTGKLHIVDYKSTSKQGDPSIDKGGWGDAYKRQMEIYQWIFRKSGFDVSDLGYFLYVNGRKDHDFYNEKLDGIMHFDTTLIPYEGNADWVESKVIEAVECLKGDVIPTGVEDCDNCRYFYQRVALEP